MNTDNFQILTYSEKPPYKKKLIVDCENYYLIEKDGSKTKLSEEQFQVIHEKLLAKFLEENKLSRLRSAKRWYERGKKQNDN